MSRLSNLFGSSVIGFYTIAHTDFLTLWRRVFIPSFMSRTRKNELIAFASGTAFCLIAAFAWAAGSYFTAQPIYGGHCTSSVPLMSSIATDIRC